MSIVQELKNIIGYYGTDLDYVFVILSIFIVIMFINIIFSVVTGMFGRRYR